MRGAKFWTPVAVAVLIASFTISFVLTTIVTRVHG
jgi:hypothetical protein